MFRNSANPDRIKEEGEGGLGKEGGRDKQPDWLLKTSDKENILKAARGKDTSHIGEQILND